MRELLKILGVAALLWNVTLGLGMWGWYLNPWIGEAGSGEHPLVLFALPAIVCLIALPQLGVPIWLSVLAGGLLQFLLCVPIAAGLRLTYRLIRRTPR